MTTTEIQRGLEGVNVAATKLCTIDGQKGQLIYAGYDIYDLAEHALSKRPPSSSGTSTCRRARSSIPFRPSLPRSAPSQTSTAP